MVGGIYNESQAVVAEASITADDARRGGGIFNSSDGTMEVVASEVIENSATAGEAEIHNDGGTLTVTDAEALDPMDPELGSLALLLGGEGVTTTLGDPIVREIAYQYDNLYRLTDADYFDNDVLNRTYDYAYSLVGNRCYAIEGDGQFTGTTYPVAHPSLDPETVPDLMHDELGNAHCTGSIIDDEHITISYYAYNALNQLTTVTTDAVTNHYTYDPAGHLTGVGSTPGGTNIQSYVWDAADRLVSQTDSNGTTSYAYDGLNNRYQQVVDSVTTNYTLGINTQLTQVLAANDDTTTTHFIPGLGQQTGSSWSYFGADGLGSVRHLFDDMGAIAYAANFDPYGVLLEQYTDANTVFGFAGEQTDANGLYNLRARYYDPALGSFLSRDPVMGAVGGPNVRFNPYLYAGGNPVNFVDPSGEFFWLLPGITWALVAKTVLIAGAAGAAIGGGFAALTGGDFFDGAVNGFFGGAVGGFLGLTTLGPWAAGLLGFGAETAFGVNWDMLRHGDKFSNSLVNNIVGGLIGEGIGRAIAFPRALRQIAENTRHGEGRRIRNATLRTLRNTGGEATPRFQGYILDEALAENVDAIGRMRARVGEIDPDVIIGMERGGAFLADAVTYGDESLSRRVVKLPRIPKDETFADAFDAQIRDLVQRGHRNFVLLDTYMGGLTARSARDAIKGLPEDVRFTNLWLRETFGFEGDVLQGLVPRRSPYARRIFNEHFDVRIAIGDDMDIMFTGAHHPLHIFNASGRVIRTVRPGFETSREALIRLLND